METFTDARPLQDEPKYHEKREQALRSLDLQCIDAPIVDIISGFSELSYCFTLQSCYGHFVHQGQRDPRNVEPLSNYVKDARINYRIAYLALCIQKTDLGKRLLQDLKALKQIDPAYIQFGSAEWFWGKCINTYAIQVEPERHKNKDSIFVDVDEALHLQSIRSKVFSEMRRILKEHQRMSPAV